MNAEELTPDCVFHPRHAEYVARVQQLEDEGCTTSDAQGIADAEWQRWGNFDRNDNENKTNR